MPLEFAKKRVCGVVSAETAREMRGQLIEGLRETSTMELRLDFLESAKELDSFLRWLAAKRPRGTFYATCRTARGGGKFRGSREEEIAILQRAARAGCRWCDVEIETAKHFSASELRSALAPARLLISHHNFRRTPRNLAAIYRELVRAGGQAIKIAAECRSIADTAKILDLARLRRNVVAVPMGETGVAGRILSLRAGSLLTYAAVGKSTAPGQLSIGAMQHLYRVEELSRKTRVYGVIGDPIGHSLSPLLHNTAFHARKVDAVFVPFLVRDLRDFLENLDAFGVAGFAITIPHKEKIIRHLDGCDPLAERIGAVNTVVVRGRGRLYGYNTDYIGALRSLEGRLIFAGSRILLFGAGGAARAAAFALAQAGASVCIASRTAARARALARATGAHAIERSALRREFFDVVINCTPVGMYPRGGSPLKSEELNCRIVMDMVYRPRQTELLQMARKKGIETVSGIEMFLAQGMAQYEIWTGQRAPEAAMRRVIEDVLAREEKSQGK